MPVVAPNAATLEEVRATSHAACFICGAANPAGFHLQFALAADGSVSAHVPCPQQFQSYHETLHGGVVAALLDAAMTNCLFARGVTAVTARLAVRYSHRVDLDRDADVTGRVERAGRGLFYCAADLSQHGRVAARATATFVARDTDTNDPNPGDGPG